jgi:hypothetical protein
MGTVTDKWTIATWIKRQRNFSSSEAFFTLRDTPTTLLGAIQFTNWIGANELRFILRNDSGAQVSTYEILDVPAFGLNTDWEFFVFTYDYNGGTVLQEFYYNGTLLDETPGAGVGDPYLDRVTVANPQQAGIDKYISVGTFEGQVFNWSMWDRVLSLSEVSSLYNGGNGFVVDYTKNKAYYSPEGLNFHYTFDDTDDRGKNFGSVSRDLTANTSGLTTYTTSDLPGKNDPTVYMKEDMSFMLNPGGGSNGHYINGPLLSSLFPSDLNTFSVSFWFKRVPGVTSTEFEAIIGSSTDWDNWTDGFAVYWGNGTDIIFWVNDRDGVNTSVEYTGFADDDWHHLVAVYDGANGELKIYDNEVVAAENLTATTANLSRTGAQNFGLGRVGNLNHGSSDYGSGFYDEVAVFDRVLTNAEISQLYNQGVPSSPVNLSGLQLWWQVDEANGDSDDFSGTPIVEDQSGNDFDGTPSIAGSSSGAGAGFFRISENKPTFQDRSLEFSSSTNYVETVSVSPYLGIHAADWSAACWFKSTATPSAADEPVIFETTDPSDESVFQFYIDDSDNLHIKLWDTDGVLFKHFSSPHEGNNVWQYVVAVFTSASDILTVYSGTDTDSSMTDITASMTKTVDNAGTMTNEGPQTIRFGNNAAHDTNFPGRIYSLTLWDDALASAEVTELLNMRSFRSPVIGSYGDYVSSADMLYHYDWKDTYYIGDNRSAARLTPAIDPDVGGVWPPSNTDVPRRY